MPLNFSPQLISIVVQCTTSTRPWYIGSKSDRNRKAEQAMRPGTASPGETRAEQTNCRPGYSRKLLLPLSSSLPLSLAQHLSSCRFGQQLRDQFVLDGGYHKFKHDRQWIEWEGPSCFGRFLLLCHVYYTRPWKTWSGGNFLENFKWYFYWFFMGFL